MLAHLLLLLFRSYSVSPTISMVAYTSVQVLHRMRLVVVKDDGYIINRSLISSKYLSDNRFFNYFYALHYNITECKLFIDLSRVKDYYLSNFTVTRITGVNLKERSICMDGVFLGYKQPVSIVCYFLRPEDLSVIQIGAGLCLFTSHLESKSVDKDKEVYITNIFNSFVNSKKGSKYLITPVAK